MTRQHKRDRQLSAHGEQRRSFVLGQWSIDPSTNSVASCSGRYRLPRKAMQVLEYLAKNGNRMVSRAELIENVWDGNAYVGEKAINNAVWRLRRTLGDHAGQPRYIETIPKTGYRLVQTPEFSQTESVAPTLSISNRPRLAHSRKRLAAQWLIVAAASLAIGALPPGKAPRRIDDELSFTNLPGRELRAAVSPNSGEIAFLWITLDSDYDIYVKSTADLTSIPRRITHTEDYELSPVWSPDGRFVAFIRTDWNFGSCRIVAHELATLKETRIDSCISDEDLAHTLSWSPDGQWLVYRTMLKNAQTPGLYMRDVSSLLASTEEQAVTMRRISCDGDCGYKDGQVSWSPNGKSLAVTRSRYGAREDLFVYDLDDRRFRQVTHGETSIKGHAWYRDGAHIVYVSNTNPRKRRLWAVDLRGGGKRELGFDGIGSPAYMPDYSSLVYHTRTVDTHIAKISLESTGIVGALPFPVVQTSNIERNAVYSAATDQLAYYANTAGHYQIWVSDYNGYNTRQLTDQHQHSTDPVWSHRGDKVAFLTVDSERDGNAVKIIDPVTLEMHRIDTGFRSHGVPQWTLDDNGLIVPIANRGKYDLWLVPLEGGTAWQLTHNGGEFGRQSPDGQSLYFTKPNRSELFRQKFPSGPEEVVTSGLFASGLGAWTFGRDNIYFVRKGDRCDELVDQHLETGDAHVLLTFPPRTFHRHGLLTYAEPHNTVLFTQRELPQVDLKISPDPLADL